MYKKIALLILIITSVIGSAPAQSPSTLESKLLTITKLMPATNTDLRDALATGLSALNPEATSTMCDWLSAPQKNYRVAAQYGLSALTYHTGRPGAESERLVFAKALIKALNKATDQEIQAFIITQLQFVGKQEAIKALEAFLQHDYLGDYATRALFTINQANCSQSTTSTPYGFTSLFNGHDLTGWTPHDGLPGDKSPTGKWTVQDGTIVGIQDPPGKGGFLTTLDTYRDFELQLETKVDWPFDTGVFLRVGPKGKSHQVTLDYRDGGEIGGIYCPWTHGFVQHCPDGIKHFKKDQWNKLRITCTDQPARIQVWLNGKKITDFQHTEKSTKGIPEEGTICLQVHPGGKGYDQSKALFRNIFVKRLDAPPHVALTDEEKAAGFVSLFNGNDLAGWIGATHSYGVKNGILYCRQGTGGKIFTEKEYEDFVFRFEFKLQPGANNGLGIRTPLEGDPAYVGMELQILDNTAKKYSNLHDWQYHGSIYGIVPAKRGYLKPVGEWNVQEVIAKGPNIKITLNGTTIVDANIKKAAKRGSLSGKDHPGLLNKTGHIGFLGHGDYLEFRNIRIREMK